MCVYSGTTPKDLTKNRKTFVDPVSVHDASSLEISVPVYKLQYPWNEDTSSNLVGAAY